MHTQEHVTGEGEKGKAIFVGDTMERDLKKCIIETGKIAQSVKVLAVKVPGTQVEANRGC